MNRQEYLKQYRAKNRDKQKVYQKLWRNANPGYEAELQDRYRAKYPDRIKITRRKQRLKIYGLTIEQFNQMLINQNGKCKICGTNEPKGFANQWAVDHCHMTGKVRGLLCTDCNKGLGYFKDSIPLLDKVKEYLSA